MEEKNMFIKITKFAERHFDKNFGGTKILDDTIEDIDFHLNIDTEIKKSLDLSLEKKCNINLDTTSSKIIQGYAPFCKLLVMRNFTNAKVGSMPITLENYQYLRSGYSARRESELPIFSRWFELPLSAPIAQYLVFVLYSKEQIIKEGTEDFDADWGVVAILGQSHDNEEPMKPETMLRNALGIEEGGSGVSLDKEKYLSSVKFWDKNATIK